MSSIRRTAAALLRAGIVLGGIGWLGLKIPPRGFRPPTEPGSDRGNATLPEGLPGPVARHFQAVLGSEFPRIESAVVWGRARFKISGLWTPVRFQTRYRAGHDFRRVMEVTWFGKSILHAEDLYVNGEGALMMRGVCRSAQSGDKISASSNIALWAESVWMPSVFVTDPRVRWEAVDAENADLVIPSLEGEERLHFHFDPETGLMDSLTAARYREQEAEKVPWHVSFCEWKPFGGMQIPTRATLTWEDESGPWSLWKVEGVAYNSGEGI